MSTAKKIKVLIVAPAAPLVGGQVIQATRLLEKFGEEEKLNVRLLAVNPSFFPSLQKIKYLRTLLTTIKYVWDLFSAIPKNDIIHIFSASYYSFLLAPTPAVLVAGLFRKKTILHYHSGEADDHLENWKRTAIPIIRLFDRTITPSNYLVDIFAKHALPADSIYNVAETDQYIFRRRETFKPIFLSNRNFEELYNVECTLRAFFIIQQKYETAELIVAGDGGKKESLLELAEELNLKNVTFTGRVSQKEMAGLYDRADIYLNSPNIDNMPNSIIEAYASGTPVVTTNVGGIPYILEDEKTGLMVEKNDCQGLAEQSIRLLENADLARDLAENGFQKCKIFSWDKIRRDWLKVYEGLMENDRVSIKN